MKKTIRGLEVKTENNSIHIIQEGLGFHGDEGDVVIISPDQVPLLIEWLKEAQAELQGQTMPVKAANGHRSI